MEHGVAHRSAGARPDGCAASFHGGGRRPFRLRFGAAGGSPQRARGGCARAGALPFAYQRVAGGGAAPGAGGGARVGHGVAGCGDIAAGALPPAVGRGDRGAGAILAAGVRGKSCLAGPRQGPGGAAPRYRAGRAGPLPRARRPRGRRTERGSRLLIDRGSGGRGAGHPARRGSRGQRRRRGPAGHGERRHTTPG